MKNETFDIEKFKKELGIKPRVLQPYNYERYKLFNPNLTEGTYKHLRENQAEWKILCGLSVSTHWGQEILKKVWWLSDNEAYKETDFYKYRFAPEHYLNLKTW
jgi:hypothetical protein